ncbi:MAG: hypothetical protein AAFV29_26245, partial [Myxococcota bacterium]
MHLLSLVIVMTVPSSSPGSLFTEISTDSAYGLNYRRTPSASSAILDNIKAQPFFTFADLDVSPLKSRGAPGVALADFDGDGSLDIYVTNGPGTANSLFLNQKFNRAFTFVDVGASSGAGLSDQ